MMFVCGHSGSSKTEVDESIRKSTSTTGSRQVVVVVVPLDAVVVE
jgi:hypothetical protein